MDYYQKTNPPGFSMKHRRIPFCDHDWSRTSTSVRTLPPQSSTSTNSATWPFLSFPKGKFSKAGAKILLPLILGSGDSKISKKSSFQLFQLCHNGVYPLFGHVRQWQSHFSRTQALKFHRGLYAHGVSFYKKQLIHL